MWWSSVQAETEALVFYDWQCGCLRHLCSRSREHSTNIGLPPWTYHRYRNMNIIHRSAAAHTYAGSGMGAGIGPFSNVHLLPARDF